MANKKDGTISVTKIDKYLKAHDNVVKTNLAFGDDGVVELEVKRFVDVNAFANMVNRAVESVFVTDEETGDVTYMAAFEDVAKADAILAYVTNCGKELATDRVYALAYSPLMDAVRTHWDYCQNMAFDDAVRRQIDHRLTMMAAGERVRLNMVMDKLDTAMNAFGQIADAYSQVDPEEMLSVVKHMQNMEEGELVKAILDARGNDES